MHSLSSENIHIYLHITEHLAPGHSCAASPKSRDGVVSGHISPVQFSGLLPGGLCDYCLAQLGCHLGAFWETFVTFSESVEFC